MAVAGRAFVSVDAFSVTEDCAPETNILWRKLGIRACPHLPCGSACRDSIALAQELFAAGRDLGFRDEIEDLFEVLRWPVEWSALHGIAEIKTPILKIATETDATEVALRVRRVGARYPSEGANGTQFPYDQKPRVRPPATSKPAFEEEARLNGFTSAAAMLRAHAPLVLAVRRRLGTGAGEIVDLGCGTGVLLGKIVAGSKLRPHGIDLRARAIAIARRNLPGWATQFHVGSIFDESPVWTRHFQFAVLSLRRLCETDENRAKALVARIRAHTQHLLIYAYAEGSRDLDVDEIGRRFNLGLGDVSEGQYVNWAWAFDTWPNLPSLK
jgi:SAM-dependent methyltransferase